MELRLQGCPFPDDRAPGRPKGSIWYGSTRGCRGMGALTTTKAFEMAELLRNLPASSRRAAAAYPGPADVMPLCVVDHSGCGPRPRRVSFALRRTFRKTLLQRATGSSTFLTRFRDVGVTFWRWSSECVAEPAIRRRALPWKSGAPHSRLHRQRSA